MKSLLGLVTTNLKAVLHRVEGVDHLVARGLMLFCRWDLETRRGAQGSGCLRKHVAFALVGAVPAYIHLVEKLVNPRRVRAFGSLGQIVGAREVPDGVVKVRRAGILISQA